MERERNSFRSNVPCRAREKVMIKLKKKCMSDKKAGQHKKVSFI